MERPNIVFDVGTDKSESHFSVEVDLDKYMRLLDEVCLDNIRILDHTLWLTSNGDHYGVADPYRNDIEVNIGKHWREYEEAIVEANNIVAGTSEITTRIDEFLFTDKLPDYLRKAPRERGLAFAKKLLLFGLNRELRSTLLHEAKHFDEPRLLSGLLTILGPLDPFEIRARRFASENESLTKWKSLIKVSHKDVI